MMSDRSRLMVEDRTWPITTTANVLLIGAISDPLGKEGLSALTGELLSRGAGPWDRAQLAEEIEFIGSTLSVISGVLTTIVTGDALTRHFGQYEAIVGKLLGEPRFEAEELEKLKRQVAADLLAVRENDDLLCRKHLARTIYRETPFSRPRCGTLASLEAITTQDVRGFYDEHYTRAGALTAAAGDIDSAQLDGFAERTTMALECRAVQTIPTYSMKTHPGIEVLVVDKPGRTQVPVLIGSPTINANHPDYLPLVVGNTIFGGTFTSRLSQEIREKRGWSYGAYSSIIADKHFGTFVMSFSPAVKDTLPAIELAVDMFCTLLRDGVTTDELDFYKNYLINSHAFSIDTSVRRLRQLITMQVNDRPPDALETFPQRVADLQVEDVNRAIRKHLGRDNLTLVAVATADDLYKDLGEWKGASGLNQVDYRSE